jgi:hypothetical protein
MKEFKVGEKYKHRDFGIVVVVSPASIRVEAGDGRVYGVTESELTPYDPIEEMAITLHQKRSEVQDDVLAWHSRDSFEPYKEGMRQVARFVLAEIEKARAGK